MKSNFVSVAGFSELRLQVVYVMGCCCESWVSVAGFSELRLQDLAAYAVGRDRKLFQLLVSLN